MRIKPFNEDSHKQKTFSSPIAKRPYHQILNKLSYIKSQAYLVTNWAMAILSAILLYVLLWHAFAEFWKNKIKAVVSKFADIQIVRVYGFPFLPKLDLMNMRHRDLSQLRYSAKIAMGVKYFLPSMSSLSVEPYGIGVVMGNDVFLLIYDVAPVMQIEFGSILNLMRGAWSPKYFSYKDAGSFWISKASDSILSRTNSTNILYQKSSAQLAKVQFYFDVTAVYHSKINQMFYNPVEDIGNFILSGSMVVRQKSFDIVKASFKTNFFALDISDTKYENGSFMGKIGIKNINSCVDFMFNNYALWRKQDPKFNRENFFILYRGVYDKLLPKLEINPNNSIGGINFVANKDSFVMNGIDAMSLLLKQ